MAPATLQHPMPHGLTFASGHCGLQLNLTKIAVKTLIESCVGLVGPFGDDHFPLQQARLPALVLGCCSLCARLAWFRGNSADDLHPCVTCARVVGRSYVSS